MNKIKSLAPDADALIVTLGSGRVTVSRDENGKVWIDVALKDGSGKLVLLGSSFKDFKL
jgi:hypothetical protein